MGANQVQPKPRLEALDDKAGATAAAIRNHRALPLLAGVLSGVWTRCKGRLEPLN